MSSSPAYSLNTGSSRSAQKATLQSMEFCPREEHKHQACSLIFLGNGTLFWKLSDKFSLESVRKTVVHRCSLNLLGIQVIRSKLFQNVVVHLNMLGNQLGRKLLRKKQDWFCLLCC